MNRQDRTQQRMQAQERSRRGGVDQQQFDHAIFREDVGVRMTTEGYNKFQEGETEYSEKYNEFSGKLKDADRKLNDATKKANDISVGKEWDKARKSFVKVNVWQGNNAKKGVEGSYYLPKNVVNEMNSKSFNQGNGSYTGSYVGNEYYVHVVPRGTSDAYGKELHNSLSSGERDIKDTFWKETEPILTAAQKKALGIIKGERDKVKGFWDELRESQKTRDTIKTDAKVDYARREKARGKALAGAM